jgi:hypothetical protein
MTALDTITLAISVGALSVAITTAIVLRHRTRDRVDIVVTHRSLPGDPLDPRQITRTAIREDDDAALLDGDPGLIDRTRHPRANLLWDVVKRGGAA